MKIVCAGNLVADIFINPIAAVPAAGRLLRSAFYSASVAVPLIRLRASAGWEVE